MRRFGSPETGFRLEGHGSYPSGAFALSRALLSCVGCGRQQSEIRTGTRRMNHTPRTIELAGALGGFCFGFHKVKKVAAVCARGAEILDGARGFMRRAARCYIYSPIVNWHPN